MIMHLAFGYIAFILAIKLHWTLGVAVGWFTLQSMYNAGLNASKKECKERLTK